MEDIPIEILSTFPLKMRMVSCTFRDAISIFDHWIKLDSKSEDNISFLMSNRLNVKYCVCNKKISSWIFPNIKGIKVKKTFKLRFGSKFDLSKYAKLEEIYVEDRNSDILYKVPSGMSVYVRNYQTPHKHPYDLYYMYCLSTFWPFGDNDKFIKVVSSTIKYVRDEPEIVISPRLVRRPRYLKDILKKRNAMLYFEEISDMSKFLEFPILNELDGEKFLVDLADYELETMEEFCAYFMITAEIANKYFEFVCIKSNYTKLKLDDQ
jgi:hypothetical protein